MINTITRIQYEHYRVVHLMASELEPANRYDAHLKTDSPVPGAYAIVDCVKVIEVARDGEDFRLSLASLETGQIRNCRMSIYGILYSAGIETTKNEQGYFKNLPLGDTEYELDELVRMSEEYDLVFREQPKPAEPLKHMALPLPIESPLY